MTIDQAGIFTYFVLFVLSVGLQLAAAELTKRKNKQKFPDAADDTPTTITSRGAWLQSLWGVHRIAPVVGWVGNRRERHVGKKFPKEIIEDAWHLLTVGRATALTAIWKDSKILWQGRITPETHPSGTTINFKIETFLSRFRIYWGEDDQPIDDIISANTTIKSRWPGICSIVVFDQKIADKGQVIAWPTYEYEIASRPIESDLSFNKWFHSSEEASAIGINPINTVVNGTSGIGYIEVAKNVTSDYFAGRVIDVTGQPLSSLTVKNSSFIKDVLESNIPSDLSTWTLVNSPDGKPAVFTASIESPQHPSPPGVTDIQYLLTTNRPLSKNLNDISGYTLTNVDLFQKEGMIANFSIYVRDFIPESTALSVRLGILNSTNEVLVRADFSSHFRSSNWTLQTINSPAGKLEFTANSLRVDSLWSKLTVSVRIESAEAATTNKILIRPGAISFPGLLEVRAARHLFTTKASVLVVAPLVLQTDITRIFFDETLTDWSSDTGTLTPSAPVTSTFNGANAAAILDELLFQESPRGAGLDTSVFDRTTLATIGNTLDTTEERASCHAIARGGTEAKELISDIMNDYGITLAWDYSAGNFIFRLNRKAPVSNPIISKSLLEGIPPLVSTNLLSKFAPKIVYPFKDRERNFTTSTVSIDDDGQIKAIANQRATKIPLKTITDFESAGVISSRKDLEHPSNVSGTELTASRAARYLLPGDIISVEDLPDLLRVSSVTPKSKSSQVEIVGLFNVYGQNSITGNIQKGRGISSAQLAADDLQSTITELEYPLVPRNTEPAIIIPRIRAHTGIIAANILISEDDNIYYSIKAIDTHSIGGTLSKNISSSAGYDPDIEAIEFTVVGSLDDYDNFPLLTEEDGISFRGGQLIGKINNEWIFFSGLQLIDNSPNKFRLLECIRGRFHSKVTSHNSGDEIYLMYPDQTIETIIGLDIIQNLAIKEQQKVFYKIQSIATDALEDPITPEAFTPVGLAKIPRRMSVLIGDKGSLEYSTTDGIRISWSVLEDKNENPPSKYGAGDFPFGQVHLVGSELGSPHRAKLELRTDPGELLKTTLDPGVLGGKILTSFTISAATISSTFGELPDSFQIWGFMEDVGNSDIKSPYTKITISKVT